MLLERVNETLFLVSDTGRVYSAAPLGAQAALALLEHGNQMNEVLYLAQGAALQNAGVSRQLTGVRPALLAFRDVPGRHVLGSERSGMADT